MEVTALPLFTPPMRVVDRGNWRNSERAQPATNTIREGRKKVIPAWPDTGASPPWFSYKSPGRSNKPIARKDEAPGTEWLTGNVQASLRI